MGLPPAAVRSFAHQLLSALSELHDQQALVHRDVKPSNMLLQQPFVVRSGKVGEGGGPVFLGGRGGWRKGRSCSVECKCQLNSTHHGCAEVRQQHIQSNPVLYPTHPHSKRPLSCASCLCCWLVWLLRQIHALHRIGRLSSDCCCSVGLPHRMCLLFLVHHTNHVHTATPPTYPHTEAPDALHDTARAYCSSMDAC